MMTFRYIAALATGLLLSSCAQNHIERRMRDPGEFRALGREGLAVLRSESPFLKAHMRGGNVYVLSEWNVPPGDTVITGTGVLFSPFRDTVDTGRFSVGLDSIALIESNVLQGSGAAAAITVLTGITALVAVVCLANPKACFGSCPTFYVGDGDSLRLMAEGFSGSIAPSLEATDVDALYRAKPPGRSVDVVMKNEAFETHVVGHVDLLAVPRVAGRRIFAASDGRFIGSRSERPPILAAGPEGDCLPLLVEMDGVERLSAADSTDLAAKETIELGFDPAPGGEYGLVIGCRQSLLTTYVLYQTYAWMGKDAGRWLAEIERGNLTGERTSAEDLIGGIEVEIPSGEGGWVRAGAVDEHGPLATDTRVLPFPPGSAAPEKVRLRMSKGTWRIDYVALAELSDGAAAVRIAPSIVLNEGKEDRDALGALLDSSRRLVTLPGDVYTLRYELPGDEQSYELFLESRGYYLEWIRQEWIVEQDQNRLVELIAAPGLSLRRLAPEFKKAEPGMEDCFWRSRYAKP